MDKEKIFLPVILVTIAALWGWWLLNDTSLDFNTERICLRKWHSYTTNTEIGNVDEWLELEECAKQYPRYQELYKKYATPKIMR